ncbi:hypothetical protein ENINCP338B1_03465 [Enterobacter intestinihominis]
MDIPRIFTVSESEHRIHNPFTPEKYATLGRVLRMKPGTRILDLGSGSGEMLCTWARDYGITGTLVVPRQPFFSPVRYVLKMRLRVCAIPLYFKLTIAVTDKQRAVTWFKG